MDSFTVTSSRLAMAAVMMGITILIYDKRLFRIRLKDLWIFIVGGLLGMLGVVLAYNEAIKQVTLSLAAVLLKNKTRTIRQAVAEIEPMPIVPYNRKIVSVARYK